jgi:hypothetical protein
LGWSQQRSEYLPDGTKLWSPAADTNLGKNRSSRWVPLSLPSLTSLVMTGRLGYWHRRRPLCKQSCHILMSWLGIL